MIKKYKRSSSVVEAIQFDGHNHEECEKFLEGNYEKTFGYPNVKTPNEVVSVNVSDYIVKEDNKFQVYIPELFHRLYSEVLETTELESPKKKTYYYVYNPKREKPSFQHDTLEEAKLEAKRLAKLCSDEVLVLAVCYSVKKTILEETEYE